MAWTSYKGSYDVDDRVPVQPLDTHTDLLLSIGLVT